MLNRSVVATYTADLLKYICDWSDGSDTSLLPGPLQGGDLRGPAHMHAQESQLPAHSYLSSTAHVTQRTIQRCIIKSVLFCCSYFKHIQV